MASALSIPQCANHRKNSQKKLRGERERKESLAANQITALRFQPSVKINLGNVPVLFAIRSKTPSISRYSIRISQIPKHLSEFLHPNNVCINYTDMELEDRVTQLLSDLSKGDEKTTDELIIVLYNELRKLASSKLARERNNITLQTTGLVHEAYLRLLQPEEQNWKSQRHFFGAAAEAMRRILIEHARSKGSLKRGQSPQQVEIEVDELPDESTSVGILDLNDALEELESTDHITAELVKLRYFAGLTMVQIAEILKVSPRKADNIWAFAKAWLKRRLKESE